MADLSLPGAELNEVTAPAMPAPVRDILQTLWRAGHAGYVVGGSLRDVLLGRDPADWDFTTDARPDEVQALFSSAVYENRFGTVAVRRDGEDYEITTFRRDHEYADHRRPHLVEFTNSLAEDLARRDFTVNAMAWGRPGDTAGETGAPDAALADPFDGAADTRAGILRAVGDPGQRFHEDALRMVRAVRLAATLDFRVEPATLAGITAHAPLAAHLSGERIAIELERLLQAPRPSIGLRLLAETGVLAAILPELARQRGVAQNKLPDEDLWDHTVRSVDAAPANRPIVRLAALLHDVGKPDTASPDGHFYEHERVGAEVATRILTRLHVARATQERVAQLVRNHMFSYEQHWSDAAIRRFIGRIGPHALEELFLLREADNVGSGLPAQDALLADLRRRVADQLEAHVPLTLADLAVDGDDLQRELDLDPSPLLGRILGSLLDQVIADSALNDRATLLMLAQSQIPEDR